MKLNYLLLLLVCPLSLKAEDSITWLATFDGKTLPGAPWATFGEPDAKLEADGLHLVDDGPGFGHYRAEWKPDGDQEIIVEAVVKMGGATGAVQGKPSMSLWPWRDGAPVMVQVSDGRHQDGLVLFPIQATNFTDRFIPMSTTSRFHTYRLVIRGTDMEMWVDGERKVQGKGAFQKPADSSQAFIQFGSTAKTATGNAVWQSVRLGVRKPSTPPPDSPLKVTLGEPWSIPRDVRQTRPYLYDMGRGLLLKSVAQGPDAFYEPYGLLKSTDGGQTWTPIPGLDQVETTPLPCLRLPDGRILAMSRWTWTQPDGRVTGKTVVLDADATRFEMFDNEIRLPREFTNESKGDQIICERHIWNDDDDGGVTMVLWSRKAMKNASGRAVTTRHSHLMRSTDEGRTWTHFSTIGPGGEPAVVRLGGGEMTAVIRGEADFRMRQTFSSDGGKTWTPAVALEMGRVLPDLVLMSNGVLACSYGRPASCLMFSLDGGKTWPQHQVISYQTGFNYTSIIEAAPGRLIYMHDAPRINALHVEVERMK